MLNLSVILMATSLVVLTLVFSTSSVAADSIELMTDRPVHALGEPVGITVAYTGGVHGDVNLSLEDSSGAVMNQWSWNHASADPFRQTVSYVPSNPGTYTVKVVHQPHHMEPSASASVQVELWSAQIANLQYIDTVEAGKPVNIEAAVSYYFTSPTEVKVELWSNSEGKLLGMLTKTLNGQGTETIMLTNVQFTSVQNQDIVARVHYQTPTAGWSHDTTGWSYNGKVTVVPEFEATPALMLLVSLLGLLFIRKRTTSRRGE